MVRSSAGARTSASHRSSPSSRTPPGWQRATGRDRRGSSARRRRRKARCTVARSACGMSRSRPRRPLPRLGCPSKQTASVLAGDAQDSDEAARRGGGSSSRGDYIGRGFVRRALPETRLLRHASGAYFVVAAPQTLRFPDPARQLGARVAKRDARTYTPAGRCTTTRPDGDGLAAEPARHRLGLLAHSPFESGFELSEAKPRGGESGH